MSNTASTTAATAAPTSLKRKGHNPLLLVLIGVLLLGVWVGLSLFQIETTEAWVLQGPPPDITNISWAVLLQAQQLFTGNLIGAAGKAIAIGWSIEIITIVFGVALEVAAHGVDKSSELLKGIFVASGFGLLAFNGYTDYSYGSLPSGFCGQLFFSLLMMFVVVFALPAGLELLLRAKQEYSK